MDQLYLSDHTVLGIVELDWYETHGTFFLSLLSSVEHNGD
jgi:hypothetical protein